MPALYGDGELWGTKGTTTLPAPNDHNGQSFDALYVIINNPDDVQLPVSEAAPGNPDYDEIMEHEDLGHLVITAGTFDGGPPAYFQCPLLPVKQ